ncbi:substrate-binding domain-containing protein [Spongiactinospora sp. 9N601]|uniref:phosphate ABC transporter substrate-binding protein PstS n=1 Tax=Spongiactinospora sp. 9N601 TaxID=3375149 RepID=UPI0037B39730
MIAGRLSRVTAAVFLALLCAAAPARGSALPPVSGAGSTFASPAIDQWIVDAGAKLGLAVSYNANGSTAGRTQFEQKLVDFASSDVSYRFPNGLANEPTPTQPFTYMPLVAGGTAMLYNLKDNAGRPITDLQLTGPLIMKIYHQHWKSNGNILWNDPMIKAENPHLEFRLPATPIIVVARKGGSGTTAVFTEYLRTQAPQLWHEYIYNSGQACYGGEPCLPTSDWPSERGAELRADSAGLADFVGSKNGTIGYAEFAYALQRGLPVARVQNKSGNYVLPTACNQAIALTEAKRNPDGTYNLLEVYNHGHPSAYPISSYNYVIVPAGGSDPAKGETMAKFVLYSITDGQKLASDLGYSPLPSNLIGQGFNALNDVPGHPPIPTDPDVWGKFYQGLALPDGTKCGDAGQKGTGGGVDGGGGVGGNDGGGQNNGDQNQNQNPNQNPNGDKDKPQNPGQNQPQNKNTPNGNNPAKNTKQPTQGPGTNNPQQTGGPVAQGQGQGPTGPAAPVQDGVTSPTSPDGTVTTTTGDPALALQQQQSQTLAQSGAATANSLIDPRLAADSAKAVDATARSAATPWALYVVAMVVITGLFLPPPLLRLIRRKRGA